MAITPEAAAVDLEVKSNVALPEEEEAVVEDLLKKEEAAAAAGMVLDRNTGTCFPVKLEDGMQLNCVGVRKRAILLGLGVKIYSFGIYADNEKLRDLAKSSCSDPPKNPTKEMYQAVIDSDVGIMVRLVIVFSSLTMGMVRGNLDKGIGAAIKKLGGGSKEDEELTNKIMGEATDDIKLTPGSVIEISRLPGYTLQTKVKGEVVSKIQSKLLCRAYIYMYLGDEPIDKDAKDKFGTSMLKLL